MLVHWWAFSQLNLYKKVSLNLANERIENVLVLIAEQGNFNFSYNSKLIDKDRRISIYAKDEPVKDVLDEMFSYKLDYRETNDYIILRRKLQRMYFELEDVKDEQKRFTVSGYVYDSDTNEGIPNVSVYEKSKSTSTLTDSNGYFILRLKGKEKSATLSLSKTEYKDTSVFVLSSVTVTPAASAKEITGKGNDNAASSFLGQFFISAQQQIQSLNLGDFFVNNPFQISLTPRLSSQGFFGSQVVNKFSFNIIGGYTAGVNGLEFGGIFNINKHSVKGVQFAGGFNIVGEDMKGVQLGGIYNMVFRDVLGVQVGGLASTARKVSGVQLNGLVSLSTQSLTGIQVSGILNVSDTIAGIQFGGILNVNKKLARGGIQAAGIMNINNGDLEGIQLAGLINVNVGKLDGIQTSGLIGVNVGDINGVQASGLFNANAKSMRGIQFAGLGNVNTLKNKRDTILLYKNKSSYTTADIYTIIRGKARSIQSSTARDFVDNEIIKRSTDDTIVDSTNEDSNEEPITDSIIVESEVSGIQLAGLFNVNSYSVKGIQAAGVFNVNTKEAKGVQFAPFVNYTGVLKGLQVGLINVADTSCGLSIGLLNVSKNGFQQLFLSANEFIDYHATFKSGTHKFYTLLHLGYQDKGTLAYGFGIGHDFKLSKRFRISANLSSLEIRMGSWSNTNRLNRLEVNLNFNIWRKFALTAGPAFNLYLQDNSPAEGYKDIHIPKGLSHRLKASKNLIFWAGWQFGITLF
jgi:hypothetical protein